MTGVGSVNKHSNAARMKEILNTLSQDQEDKNKAAKILQDNSVELLQIINYINDYKTIDVTGLDIAHFLMGLKSLEDIGFDKNIVGRAIKGEEANLEVLEGDGKSKLFSSGGTFINKSVANILKNDVLKSNRYKFSTYFKVLREEKHHTENKLNLLVKHLEDNKRLVVVNTLLNKNSGSVSVNGNGAVKTNDGQLIQTDSLQQKYDKAVDLNTKLSERAPLIYEIINGINEAIVVAKKRSNNKLVAQYLQKLAKLCEETVSIKPASKVERELAMLCYVIAADAYNKLSELDYAQRNTLGIPKANNPWHDEATFWRKRAIECEEQRKNLQNDLDFKPFSSEDDTNRIATCYENYAYMMFELKDYKRAVEMWLKAVDLYINRTGNEPKVLAIFYVFLNNRMIYEKFIEDHFNMEKMITKCDAITKNNITNKDPHCAKDISKGVAIIYKKCAQLILERDTKKAAELYSKAAGLYENVPDNKSAADCYSAHAKLVEKEYSKAAAELYSKAADLYEKAGDNKSAADCYSAHAKLIEKEYSKAAAELHSKAAALYENVKDNRSAACCYGKCADATVRLAEGQTKNNPSEAMRLFDESAKMYKKAINLNILMSTHDGNYMDLDYYIKQLVVVSHKNNKLDEGISFCTQIADKHNDIAVCVYNAMADQIKTIVSFESYTQKHPNEAGEYLIKVAEFYKKSNSMKDTFEAYLIAAEKADKDNYKLIIECYSKAMKIANNLVNIPLEKKIFILQELAKAYKKNNQARLSANTESEMNIILSGLSEESRLNIERLNKLREFKYNGVIFIENVKMLATSFARQRKVVFEETSGDKLLPETGNLDPELTHLAIKFLIQNDNDLKGLFTGDGYFNVVTLHHLFVLSNLQKGEHYNNEAASIMTLASEILYFILPNDAPELKLCQSIMENYENGII